MNRIVFQSQIILLNSSVCNYFLSRLKNADGTLTTLALGNCIAMQRLVLTGTPIQNHLDELFAVVNFAAPGYLGTLKDFQVSHGMPVYFWRWVCSEYDFFTISGVSM